MSSAETDIKTMQLYFNVHRIYQDLAELSYGPNDELKVEDVSRFDQYHYCGTQPADEAIQTLGLNASSRVLDFGSGIGGPARYIANATNCHVLAVDMQRDLHEVATDLTKRTGLDDRVTHKCANLLVDDIGETGFDAVISWLCILHISDKEAALKACFDRLRRGGKIDIDDIFALAPFTSEEQADLNAIYAQNLPNEEQYRAKLAKAGFTNIQWKGLTEEYRKFTRDRMVNFRANADNNIKKYGEETYKNLQTTYDRMDRLFSGGHLGGTRISATKPL